MVTIFVNIANANDETPNGVTQKFWNAMVDSDIRTAKSFTIRSKIKRSSLLKVKLKGVELKEAKVINGHAFVPTTIFFTIPIEAVEDKECNITMDTELLKVEGRWLVDDIVTMESYNSALKDGLASCSAKILEDAVGLGKEQYEELQKKLKKSYEKFGDSLESIKESLKKSLKKFKEDDKPASQLPESQKVEKI
jgi:uncharacterized protein YukE